MALDPYCGALHFSLLILQDSGSMHWAPVPLLWQLDIVGVTHFVMDCFEYLDAASSFNEP